MNALIYLLNSTSSIVGGASSGSSVAQESAQTGGFVGINPVMMIILYCVVIFAIMYFFSIRPQKKREAEAATMRSKIKVGDSVLLNNGMYGVISDITAECFVVEFGITNRTIRIPVLKREVALIKEPNLSNKEVELPKEENNKKLSIKKDDK